MGKLSEWAHFLTAAGVNREASVTECVPESVENADSYKDWITYTNGHTLPTMSSRDPAENAPKTICAAPRRGPTLLEQGRSAFRHAREDKECRPRETCAPQQSIVAKWCRTRGALTKQLVGVIRHTERADASWAVVHGSFWHRTDDCINWPLDPPLSDSGVERAKMIGHRVRDAAEECGAHVHVVVTSPFLRCIQTAVEICCQLGPGTRLLIDNSLVEIYGPWVLGSMEPKRDTLVHPLEYALALCKRRGVSCEPQCVGRWPIWPETLRESRRRYANRFLTYLRRSVRVRRNFLIVSHADCVGAALSMMPSEVGSLLDKVDYGGMFLATRASDVRKRKSCPGRMGEKSDDLITEASPQAEDAETTHMLWSSEASELSAPVVVPDGWRVQSFDIQQSCVQDSTKPAHHQIQDLIGDEHFSHHLLERLLFSQLSAVPLGDDDDCTPDAAQGTVCKAQSLSLSRNASFTNSTLIFGASNCDTELASERSSFQSSQSDADMTPIFSETSQAKDNALEKVEEDLTDFGTKAWQLSCKNLNASPLSPVTLTKPCVLGSSACSRLLQRRRSDSFLNEKVGKEACST